MRFGCRIETQLSIFAENKPGRMAKICYAMGNMGINIFSLSVHDAVDHSIMRLIVDNPTKALILLEEDGFYIVTHKIVTVAIAHSVGALGEISSLLARADDNIEYAYCTAQNNADSALLVLKTPDAERTLEILEES
ncbi:MAG: hypothetical protein ACI9CF_000327 [Candidatus Omnitrophota bacterium]|jgi:hypothetical protein